MKLLDRVTTVQERMVEIFIEQQVCIDDKQFGFMAGRGTTDTIIVRKLQEKFSGINKTLYISFLDLEKAFDPVPRHVIWWALRKRTSRRGWCVSYRAMTACAEMLEAECVWRLQSE